MKRILWIVCAIISFMEVVKAQDGNNTSYFLSNLPQRYRLNPAYQPEYKVFVGLPVLSGIAVNYLNSSFTAEDMLYKKNDSVYMDINKFYKSLHKRNYMYFNNEISILSVGVKAKKWYGTLDIAQRSDFLFRYNKDLFTFLKYGNLDQPAMDFGKFGVNVNAYLEVAFGLSREVNDKLTVGGRLKFLMGVANVHMTDSELNIVTEEDGTMKLHSRQNIRVAAPVRIRNEKNRLPFELNQPIEWDDIDFNTDDLSVSDILNAKNPGFAIDLGGEYKFNDRLNLFASLTDLGFIRWGNKEFTYHFYQDADFVWDGADISHSINNKLDDHITVDSAFQKITDDLKDNFRLKNKGSSYTTLLSPKLYLGATYQLNRTFNAGGLFRASLINGMFIPSLTASVNGRLIRNVSASVSYSITRGSYVNVGAGITAKLGPLQLYLQTDNLLACNYTNTQSASGRFGINLLFGHKDHKKKSKVVEETPLEEEMIAPVPVKKDSVQPDTAVVTADITADPVTPMKQEKVTDTAGDTLRKFYVIVGSFKSKEKAENLRKRLNFMGFKDNAILLNEKGMYRVSAAYFNTHAACWEEVFRVRKEYPQFSDAWGLAVE